MGYTLLHAWHLSPEPSAKSFTGALQRGHTKISSKSCRTAMPKPPYLKEMARM
jgi:hypothetical protein